MQYHNNIKYIKKIIDEIYTNRLRNSLIEDSVPREGVEPPRPKALVPKTSVSTNSTIAARTKI